MLLNYPRERHTVNETTKFARCFLRFWLRFKSITAKQHLNNQYIRQQITRWHEYTTVVSTLKSINGVLFPVYTTRKVFRQPHIFARYKSIHLSDIVYFPLHHTASGYTQPGGMKNQFPLCSAENTVTFQCSAYRKYLAHSGIYIYIWGSKSQIQHSPFLVKIELRVPF
jgi:hypothetical protein